MTGHWWGLDYWAPETALQLAQVVREQVVREQDQVHPARDRYLPTTVGIPAIAAPTTTTSCHRSGLLFRGPFQLRRYRQALQHEPTLVRQQAPVQSGPR